MFISLSIEGRHWPWYTKRSKETKTHKCSGIERKVAIKTTDGWGTLQEKRRKAKGPMTKMNIGIGGKGEIVRIILMSIEGE